MAIAAALALITNVNVQAGETASPIQLVLSGVSATDMPAKAAQLVSQADATTIKQTTIDVVKAAINMNPAAVELIVGAIAKSNPEMAGTAAATAAGLLPSQVVAIARAAASAAPKQAKQIVEALCRALPSAYQKIANAVAQVVPGADKEILEGIAAAIPSLKNSINTVLANYNAGGKTASVDQALPEIAHSSPSTITLASAFMAPSMVSQPPFTPSGTSVITNRVEATNGTSVVTNGHSYGSAN